MRDCKRKAGLAPGEAMYPVSTFKGGVLELVADEADAWCGRLCGWFNLNEATAYRPQSAPDPTYKLDRLMETTMRRALQLIPVFLVATAVVVFDVATAHACNPHITMSQVDKALASTGLKGSKLADANALRDYMAEAVQRNDQTRARHLETQVMVLMGYVEDPPVSRSAGCTRTWSKKAQ